MHPSSDILNMLISMLDHVSLSGRGESGKERRRRAVGGEVF